MRALTVFARTHRPQLAVLAVFAVIYALVFVPNHLLFRTYALDLGLYTHAACTYAHGRMADCMLFLGNHQSLLADHFDLHLMLWSPLTWVFGQWTLLLVQWVAVLWGAWGMFRWLLALGADRAVATLGLVHFCAFFGILGAITFDFHSNVVATMAVPWYGLALHERRNRAVWLLLFFMLAAKESMGIWLFAVALGLAWHYRKVPGLRKLLLLQAVVALGWSLVVLGAVMPALSHSGHYDHWMYPALGHGPLDALRPILMHPLDIAAALLDGRGIPDGRAIKVEMLVFLFLAGGWAMLARPWILLMAAPLLLEKLLHAGPAQWGVLGHYSVGFAPLCTLAVFGRPTIGRWARTAHLRAWTGAILSIAVTVRCMDASIHVENRSRQRIYQVIHYQRDYDVPEVRSLIASIPADAAVSASSPFLPHLTMRRELYQYPILGRADYILLATEEDPYPISREDLRTATDSLSRSRFWRLDKACDGALLFKHRP